MSRRTQIINANSIMYVDGKCCCCGDRFIREHFPLNSAGRMESYSKYKLEEKMEAMRSLDVTIRHLLQLQFRMLRVVATIFARKDSSEPKVSTL